MNKLILIVLDGLNAEIAFRHLGFMEHLVEQKKAAVYLMESELPTMSRPLYEVIQTGVPVIDHGIYHNGISRKTTQVSTFQLVQERGGSTAAAAYHWVYDLYIGQENNPIDKRIAFDGEGFIDRGIFYWEDHYPDDHLFADGNYLIKKYHPDYILIHSMEIDTVGHDFGSESKEYMDKTVRIDILLSHYLPLWKSLGYEIIVTADHGMNGGGQHSGSHKSEREVPLYLYSEKVKAGDFRDSWIKQLELAPLCCKLLNIEKSDKMTETSIEVED